jgi:hypothetical protein
MKRGREMKKLVSIFGLAKPFQKNHEDMEFTECCQTTYPTHKWMSFFDDTGFFDNEYDMVRQIPTKPLVIGDTVPEFSPLFDKVMNDYFIRCLTKRQKINMMYSGGIDSTAIAAAILKSPYAKDLKHYTTFHISESSIWENPEFYWKHIIPNFRIKAIDYDNTLADDSSWLGGEFGDNIQSVLIAQYQAGVLGNGTYAKNYKTEIPCYLRTMGVKESFIEKMVAFGETCPFPLINCQQYWWWFSYTNRWQDFYYRLYKWSRHTVSYKEYQERVFYPFLELQNWGATRVANLNLDNVEAIENVRRPFKEYTYDFDKNIDFLENKGKVASQSYLTRFTRKPVIWQDLSWSSDWQRNFRNV